MGYCDTCNEWCGYSTSVCENVNCQVTKKLIGLYGIDKISNCLTKVFIRNEKAVDNRTNNIDKISNEIKKEIELKQYSLRSKKN